MTALVLAYRAPVRHALDVLWGAVEVTPTTARLPVVAAEPADLEGAVRAAVAAHGRVVVAWSFYSAGFEAAAAALAALRAACPGPGVLHVAGGPHASAAPAATLAAGFDLVATGEGELTLPALMARVAAGEDPRLAPGLAWLDGEGRLATGARPPMIALDDFPPCAPGAVRRGPIGITRGCVWACRFCQTPFLFKARFRHRSLEGVRRWARWLYGTGARDLRFLTPSALSWGSADGGVDLDAVEALLATVREEAGPSRRVFFGTFPSELRPEHVSARALALVRRHCDNGTVLLGGQSGSPRVLEAMGRGHGVEDVERAARLAVEAGLVPDVDLVFGLPGEEEADRAATRALAARLAAAGARVHAHAFMPLPGTPWASAAPGEIDAETRRLLDRLASAGHAHGQWRRQERLAAASKPPLAPHRGQVDG
ncbi:MAG: TIGR04013 family B12-binding domain/radical SAM domain-containing protein [Anaeromyxobacteraceae bacterium]